MHVLKLTEKANLTRCLSESMKLTANLLSCDSYRASLFLELPSESLAV